MNDNNNMNLENNQNLITPINPELREITAGPVPVVPVNTEPAKKSKKSGVGKVIALALCCSLLGGAAGAGGVAAYSGLFQKDSTAAEAGVERTASEVQIGQRENQTLSVKSVTNGKEMSAAEIYEANVNATVGITTSVTTNYWGYRTTSAASGSGFILTADGYIVTNYHVIEDASEIKVTTFDDKSYSAKLVGYDENNDLAVLKIEATGLQAVVLGDSDQLRVGDSVVAIGNPLGELTFSLTHGAVSALNRKITISNNAMTLIQTDCAINSGNSGGALFNSYGEVIGITNAKYSGNGSSGTASIDNVGFAIPINSVVNTIRAIIEDGYVEKPYIGVTVYNLDSQYQAFGLSGAAVQSVESGSPAEQAGLQKNDVITAVNGKEISGTDELIKNITACEKGDVITLTIYRQGKTLDIEVTVAIRRQSYLPDDTNDNSTQQYPNGSPRQQYPNGSQGQQGQQYPNGSQGQQGQSGTNPFGDGSFPFSDGTFPFSQSELPEMNGNTFPGGNYGN
ncbi:MAG: trypsin-like peptidase domain-containing protein [Lachnospiraceae bacterium]|nr:trypsin-like peptidase domain-containing protein [Lachnospiraceae bacterium]